MSPKSALNICASLAIRCAASPMRRPAIAALRLDANVVLVFSDILMPGGMNGLDLAREIRRAIPRHSGAADHRL